MGSVSRAREVSLYWLSGDLKILKSAQGLTAVSGAAVIQVAFAILSSIAIDQFVEIETARPKLEAALALAKQAVDLDVLRLRQWGGHAVPLLVEGHGYHRQ